MERLDLSATDLRELANLEEINLSCVNLTNSNLQEVNLSGANLQEATLVGADMTKANLFMANLCSADLRQSILEQACLIRADLVNTQLQSSNLRRANLFEADLRESDLESANLSRADLVEVDLRDSNLKNANLRWSTLESTNLCGVCLDKSKVYGISAWRLDLEGASQRDLVITRPDESAITIDNLDFAQFVYLLVTNPKIRGMIDTVGKKAVLILGRFTKDRKAVLDAIRDELRYKGLVPIIFDFDKPNSRDLTETVSILAHLARFVVADITGAKSIPQELSRIVPNLPSLPVQPIILSSESPYAMFGDLGAYPTVLTPYRYEGIDSLIANLNDFVVAPALAKSDEIVKRRHAFEAQLDDV